MIGHHDRLPHHRQIDHRRHAAHNDVPLPAGILKPNQFGHAAGQGNQIRLAVVVHVRHHHLVAAFEVGGNGVGGEANVSREEQQRK